MIATENVRDGLRRSKQAAPENLIVYRVRKGKELLGFRWGEA
jgi:hypothetical protein